MIGYVSEIISTWDEYPRQTGFAMSVFYSF